MGDESKKVQLQVEVRLKSGCSCSSADVKESVERLLKSRTISFNWRGQAVEFAKGEDPFLDEYVERIYVCERETEGSGGEEGGRESQGLPLLFWQLEINLSIYQLSLDEPAEEIEGDDEIASFTEYFLPSVHFEGLWESLQFDENIKQQLLNYSRSALLFSKLKVNSNIIAFNRLVLLHGPPGTGKTSLCKALAHKLSVKHFPMSSQPQAEINFSKLIEINAHSLFSKWFSESGKLVSKLFQQIRDLAELALDMDDMTMGSMGDPGHGSSSKGRSLVFVLIDEVESLAVARKASIQGGEPSDGIRAVNALLTQLDQLKAYPNVYVMCTSNVSDAIDEAFLDRADLKIYLGNPSMAARYDILVQGVNEMHRVGLISDEPLCYWHEHVSNNEKNNSKDLSFLLCEICTELDGESGRQLRKLPFLCFSKYVHGTTCTLAFFLQSLLAFVRTKKDNVISNSMQE